MRFIITEKAPAAVIKLIKEILMMLRNRFLYVVYLLNKLFKTLRFCLCSICILTLRGMVDCCLDMSCMLYSDWGGGRRWEGDLSRGQEGRVDEWGFGSWGRCLNGGGAPVTFDDLYVRLTTQKSDQTL